MGTLRIALDPSISSDAPEVKYVFRTLLRAAGYSWEFCWAGDEQADIYYGAPRPDSQFRVSIHACGLRFAGMGAIEPENYRESKGLPFLDFKSAGTEPLREQGDRVSFSNDIILSSYWLLIGAREPAYVRDRWDNLDLSGSFFLRNSLQRTPVVSLYAAFLRRLFQGWGYEPLTFSGAGSFLFTHDVDYPQMIRWIECLRLAAARGFKSLPSIAGILRGTNHFWTFREWVDFERELGAKPAFYFMARRGSLLEYACGTPDDFYDIHAPEFRELFRYLKGEGCEIGLHASYHAHRIPGQLEREKKKIEECCGTSVEGGRHHYWHLNPAAPNDTLLEHERAGLTYDSSLGLEFYPGFRRGICHPFRVFHPGERREIGTLQLPPAWMDDHFDRRLLKNQISDCEEYAAGLLDMAARSGGITVIDYHSRGMNGDFYPRYGAWFMEFARKHLDSSIPMRRPGDLTRMYQNYESELDRQSRDLTQSRETVSVNVVPEKLSIGLLQAGEEQRWEEFVQGHPRGSIYHTLGWRAVTEEGLGHQAYYVRAIDSNGRIAGVLPLFLIRGLMGRRLVSVPMRDRGGVLAHDGATASLLVEHGIELTRELKCKYLELRSLDEIASEVSQPAGLKCERYWITTRIDLSPGVEKLWKALDRDSIRWAINKAGREGMRFDIDATEEGTQRFYDLFVNTRSAMGIPPYPRSLFLAIWRHLIAKGKANLFLVWKGADLVHGMINLLSKSTFIPAYAAPQNQWRKHHLNEFMFWSTIRWAKENGFEEYDFGADSPLQKGLMRFKEKWGGVARPMNYYYFLNTVDAPPNFDSSSRVYTAMRAVWRNLPVPISKPLGGWVTRQLS